MASASYEARAFGVRAGMRCVVGPGVSVARLPSAPLSLLRVADPGTAPLSLRTAADGSLGQARKLCPEVQAVPYEFARYKETASVRLPSPFPPPYPR